MATTTPLRIAGGRLALNYATSAAGSIQVEVLDESGAPIGGFGRQDMAPLFGDEIEAEVRWTSADLASLKGRVVRLRFVLKDADLYAFRSAER
jgi:hypothetical protein